jgi:hypothetical protein
MSLTGQSIIAVVGPVDYHPGGNPVIALPGLTLTLPRMIVTPVLVTVELPKIEKFCAPPSEMVWVVTGDRDVANSAETINVTARAPSVLGAWVFWCKPLLARSEFLTDLQCQDRKAVAAAPKMTPNDQRNIESIFTSWRTGAAQEFRYFPLRPSPWTRNPFIQVRK